MVVMGFSFAVWVEGLDFGLRFPAKTILAGFRVVVVTDFPRQLYLRLLKKSDKFLAFFVFWRKIKI